MAHLTAPVGCAPIARDHATDWLGSDTNVGMAKEEQNDKPLAGIFQHQLGSHDGSELVQSPAKDSAAEAELEDTLADQDNVQQRPAGSVLDVDVPDSTVPQLPISAELCACKAGC